MTWPAPSPSRRRRPLLAVLVAGVMLAAGCGGDDEDNAAEETGTSAEPPTRTVTVPARTAPEEERTEAAPAEDEGSGKEPASPEESPGGAGDEEAARSEVVLTGRGGKIGPILVKVPPFIAIHVVLRSGDGKPYVLRVGNRVIRAGLKGSASSATFDGLRPGKRLLGSAVSGKVVIEASAEPGP